MAVVLGASSGRTFDPQFIAREYLVSLTDLPADEKWLGKDIDFKPGSDNIYRDPFTIMDYQSWPRRTVTGYLEEPQSIFVEVSKMSDLTNSEDTELQNYLDAHGYKDAWKKALTGAKWRKLLPLSLEEIEELPDYDLVNAVDYLVDGDAGEWEALTGVYGRDKKGRVKFVVTRRPKGTGL